MVKLFWKGGTPGWNVSQKVNGRIGRDVWGQLRLHVDGQTQAVFADSVDHAPVIQDLKRQVVQKLTDKLGLKKKNFITAGLTEYQPHGVLV